MKSPVYGLGRNRKHRPPGASNHAGAGQVNMKGKREKVMSCNCCFCLDKRDEMLSAIHRKEMNHPEK